MAKLVELLAHTLAETLSSSSTEEYVQLENPNILTCQRGDLVIFADLNTGDITVTVVGLSINIGELTRILAIFRKKPKMPAEPTSVGSVAHFIVSNNSNKDNRYFIKLSAGMDQESWCPIPLYNSYIEYSTKNTWEDLIKLYGAPVGISARGPEIKSNWE